MVDSRRRRKLFGVCFSAVATAVIASSISGAAELAGTEWRLQSLVVNGRAVRIDRTARRPTLRLEEDRTGSTDRIRVSGSGGCNRYSGSAVLSSRSRIEVGRLASTRMACDESVMALEREFLEALEQATTVRESGSRLTLTFPAGRMVLTADGDTEYPDRGSPFPGSFGRIHRAYERRFERDSDRARSVLVLYRGGDAVETTVAGNRSSSAVRRTGTWRIVSAGGDMSRVRIRWTRSNNRAIDDEIVYRQIGNILVATRYDRTVHGREPLRYERIRESEVDDTIDLDVREVSGTVTYRQRSALPSDAVLTVELVDVSGSGSRGRVVADEEMRLRGRQVPVSFRIRFDPSDIDTRRQYEVRARITVDRDTRFASTRRYPVLTRGRPNRVDLVVEPARDGRIS